MDLHELTIEEAAKGLRDKEFSSVELTEAFLARIEKHDKDLNAFLLVDEKRALAQAQSADEKFAKEEADSPLQGVPVAIKDNIVIQGQETTAGSNVLKGYVPPYTATAAENLLKNRAVVLGKTNLDDFAMGASTENSAFGPTKNPWDKTRVPGGSSGGSAAAVSAQLTTFAIGSDTGGSIRQPAGFTGITGMKPTYGRVSRHGLIAMASSFDQIGPMTRTVRDAAVLLNHLVGFDEMDATTVKKTEEDFTKELGQGIKGLKIGLPKEYFVKELDDKVKNLIEQAVKKLEEQGAVVKEVSIPTIPHCIEAYYIITPVEVASNAGRYDGIKFGYSAASEAENLLEVYEKSRGQSFGREVQRRILLGTYASSAGYFDQYYKQAQRVQQVVRDDFKKVFSEVDLIAGPTSPHPAFPIGEKSEDPLAMYLEDIFTVPANITGLPAISVPCGLVDNLPVGLQLTGSWWDEARLLRAADAYQQVTEFHKLKPEL